MLQACNLDSFDSLSLNPTITLHCSSCFIIQKCSLKISIIRNLLNCSSTRVEPLLLMNSPKNLKKNLLHYQSFTGIP